MQQFLQSPEQIIKPIVQIPKVYRINLPSGNSFYINNRLYQDLQQLKKDNLDDWDSIILITGKVGTGKTVIGTQVQTTIDPTFNMNQLCFNGEQFEDKVMNDLKRLDGIQLDEAIDGMDSKEHYKQINIRMHKLVGKMRQKNLYVTACIPRVQDLSDFVIDRAALWIRCYTINKKRGFMMFIALQD